MDELKIGKSKTRHRKNMSELEVIHAAVLVRADVRSDGRHGDKIFSRTQFRGVRAIPLVFCVSVGSFLPKETIKFVGEVKQWDKYMFVCLV